MPRLSVPADHERDHISVAGSADYHYGEADVNTDAVRNARDLSVREDEEGRYVGVSEHYADEVAAFLGVDAPDTDEDGGDGDSETDEDVCGAELSDGGTCERPASECPYHGDDS